MHTWGIFQVVKFSISNVIIMKIVKKNQKANHQLFLLFYSPVFWYGLTYTYTFYLYMTDLTPNNISMYTQAEKTICYHQYILYPVTCSQKYVISIQFEICTTKYYTLLSCYLVPILDPFFNTDGVSATGALSFGESTETHPLTLIMTSTILKGVW